MKYEIENRVAAIVLAGIVTVFSTAFFVAEKKEFSEQENRYLSSFPKFSFQKLEEGDYTKELDRWLCDHFPLRDGLMSLKAAAEKGMGKTEINGVYLGKDGFLLERYQKPQNTQKIIRQLSAFQETVTTADVTVMLIPTAITIYENKLPAYAQGSNQRETIEVIQDALACDTLDITEELLYVREEYPLYYRLDHHWTSYGAYVAYASYCEARGKEPLLRSEFVWEEVSTDFKGTIYSKVKDYSLRGDVITACYFPNQELSVYYADTKETRDSLFAYEYLEKKDQYSFFLNNIHPLVEITNETANTEEELVLIKDSYANSMIPFLTAHYKKIYVFDTRYYKESVSEWVRAHENVSEVLILYNLGTMDSDLGIGGIY